MISGIASMRALARIIYDASGGVILLKNHSEASTHQPIGHITTSMWFSHWLGSKSLHRRAGVSEYVRKGERWGVVGELDPLLPVMDRT